MGHRITDDVTGKELPAEDAARFKAELVLRLLPSGKEAVRLETPAIYVERTSRNIVDNVEYQDFEKELAPLVEAMTTKFNRFWSRYKRKLKGAKP